MSTYTIKRIAMHTAIICFCWLGLPSTVVAAQSKTMSLETAIIENDNAVAKILIEQDAKNSQKIRSKAYSQKFLRLALANHTSKVLGWLVDGGVDVNVPIYKGEPTILAAIALSTQMALMPSSDAMLKTQPPPPNQGEETLKKILQRTKNINSTDDKGRSLLVIAIEENARLAQVFHLD